MSKNWNVRGIVVTEFDEVEWMAYAGAERFFDASRPVLAGTDGGGDVPACVVIGALDGVEVYCGSEDERGYLLHVEGLTQPMALLLVASVLLDIMPQVPATLTLEEEVEAFKRFGFVQTCG